MAGTKQIHQLTLLDQAPSLFSSVPVRDYAVSSPMTRRIYLFREMETLMKAVQVEDTSLSDPTALSPSDGDTYIVASSGGGAWAGHGGEIAGWTSLSWHFITPTEGFLVYDRAGDKFMYYDGLAWGSLFDSLAAEGDSRWIDAKAGTQTLAASAGSAAIAFTSAFASANYAIALTAHADENCWITAKSASGFTINRNPSTSQTDVDWIATPHRDP